MRQTGVFAACGLVALEDWQEYLQKDHENAAFLAHELATIPGVMIDPTVIETNILRFSIDPKVCKKKKMDHRAFAARLKEEFGVLCNPGFANDNVRFVTHRDVSRSQCEQALSAVKAILA